MNSYNLGGHSGCQIFLIEDDDGKVFVRKISKNKDYNARLKIQSEKQAAFRGGQIKTPVVYRSSVNEDGLFYFDMEYVYGMTLAEYIKSMEIGKVHRLVDILVENLVPKTERKLGNSEKKQINGIFEKKLSSLDGILAKKNNPVVNEALDILHSHDWSKFTPTVCHGDMTLENILIKNEEIYFIDFLDSFYDSWLLDIGTLFQDVQVMWSYRYAKKISMNTVLRLIVFRDLLLDAIGAINKIYLPEIYYALLQKLLRIYPYTADRYTYEFLNEKTEIILNSIKRMEDKG